MEKNIFKKPLDILYRKKLAKLIVMSPLKTRLLMCVPNNLNKEALKYGEKGPYTYIISL